MSFQDKNLLLKENVDYNDEKDQADFKACY